jgi:hypothetical protein
VRARYIEVTVLVEHDESGGFCSCSDEEVGDLRPALLTEFGRGVLNVHGSIEHPLVRSASGS